jgi:cytidylate kinase
MSSVMISSRSFTPGAKIASAVAEALRLEVIDESLYEIAAGRFGVPAADLRRAMQHGPSLWGMSGSHRRRFALCVQAALSSRLTQSDAVYHGPFAGLLLRGIAHLFKVRVTANPDDRAAEAARQGVAAAKAARRVRSSDSVENDIARVLFGLDDMDSEYDLVVDLSEVAAADAVDSIVQAANSAAYRTTAFSRGQLLDCELADGLAARLACELGIEVEVRVCDGATRIRAQAPERKRNAIRACAESHAASLDGIREIEVETVESWLRPLPASLR